MKDEKTPEPTASDLNAIVRLRRCYHKDRAKPKMVATVFCIGSKHYQRFEMKECCCSCGVVMQPNAAVVRLSEAKSEPKHG